MEKINEAYIKFCEKGSNGITPFISNINSKENIIHNLLALYIEKINLIAVLIEQQANTYNEVFDLLVQYPNELKFSKQLFLYRQNPEMNLVFLYGINAVKSIVFPLLKNHFKLNEKQEHFDSIWTTFVDTWYSRLDINNLTAKHMKDISEETAEIIIKLNKKR